VWLAKSTNIGLQFAPGSSHLRVLINEPL